MIIDHKTLAKQGDNVLGNVCPSVDLLACLLVNNERMALVCSLRDSAMNERSLKMFLVQPLLEGDPGTHVSRPTCATVNTLQVYPLPPSLAPRPPEPYTRPLHMHTTHTLQDLCQQNRTVTC